MKYIAVSIVNHFSVWNYLNIERNCVIDGHKITVYKCPVVTKCNLCANIPRNDMFFGCPSHDTLRNSLVSLMCALDESTPPVMLTWHPRFLHIFSSPISLYSQSLQKMMSLYPLLPSETGGNVSMSFAALWLL